jgi:hypothetical protein
MGVFNHTFFRFAVGFFVILGISFSIIFAVGLYETHYNSPETAGTSTSDTAGTRTSGTTTTDPCPLGDPC